MRSEDSPAPPALGGPAGTGPGPAGMLLGIELPAAAGHLRPGLGGGRAQALVGLLADHRLVQDCHILLDPKDLLLDLYLAAYLALQGVDWYWYHGCPFWMSSSPPLAPGTAPRTRSRFLSLSAWTTSRPCTVTLSAPRCPA